MIPGARPQTSACLIVRVPVIVRSSNFMVSTVGAQLSSGHCIPSFFGVLHCQTLVAGRSLARQLRGARLSPAEVTRLGDELLQVLDYLHDHDVVHRDIKPDNVVIAADGGAHLVDFGAARRLHVSDDVDPEPTVVGTPGYMAPEQARGELVAQSDLYALGRLLTEALAGAEPERPLAALLPMLCKQDWRERPASAGAALKQLHDVVGCSG